MDSPTADPGPGEGAGPTPRSSEIDQESLRAAERLIELELTEEERAQILATLDDHREFLRSARGGELDFSDPPAETFDPRLPGVPVPEVRRGARFDPARAGRLPDNEAEIAFADVRVLARWLQSGALTSERLTGIYLRRLEEHGPRLECVVRVTADDALASARERDRERAAGKARGPLHGIPWGAKDIIDTVGVATEWGAEPFRGRLAERNARVVERLEEEGAVLVAKLSTGALAYGDVWSGGRTRNPWRMESGSGGSSAGSAAAVAAGLVGFALGTETYGSIQHPCARCGAAGFRPTFGRVSRAGVMPLAWSIDKVGPVARCVEDTALVLDVISGPDPDDPSTTDVPLNVDMTRPIRGVRVGFSPDEYDGAGAGEADRQTLEHLRRLGVELVPVVLPTGPHDAVLRLLLHVEAAAAFDALTRTNRDDELRRQDVEAWPNLFRRARFFPAVDYVQARRLRRRFMRDAARLFADVEVVIAPWRHQSLHALTNLTGHPALTLRQHFVDDGTPRGLTLWGRLYDDATLLRVGGALEEALGVAGRRPPGF